MPLGRRVKWSNLLIPSQPVRAVCEQCNAERDFRLLIHCEVTQFLYLFQWDYDDQVFRACVGCGRAYPINDAQLRRLFPAYRPRPSNFRRHLVLLVIWVPIIAFLILYYLDKLK